MADSAGSQVSEGVAPITTELRETIRSLAIDDSVLTIGGDDFHRLCDAIDAVHAQLERDYKVACEVNERQDEQYADMVHNLDRAYEKNRNQRRQLAEVQEALHRRNEGDLKVRWQKELDRLERENEDLRRQLESLMFDSRPMTDENMAEHGWYRALDADKKPVRVGDKVDSDHYDDGTVTGIQFYEMSNGGIRTLIAVRPDGWDVPTWHTPDEYRHYHAPTVEDVLREMHAELDEVTALYVGEAIDSDERDRDEARIFAEYAAKLRLAGSDAE